MTSNTIPKALFIGRWQPFHKGHEWLIEQKLSKGIPVLIAVRNVDPDNNNPLDVFQVMNLLREVYKDNPLVEIMAISDIESVNYGRGVGYEVNELKPSTETRQISATEIRRKIRNGDDSWKDNVNPAIHNLLEQYLK